MRRRIFASSSASAATSPSLAEQSTLDTSRRHAHMHTCTHSHLTGLPKPMEAVDRRSATWRSRSMNAPPTMNRMLVVSMLRQQKQGWHARTCERTGFTRACRCQSGQMQRTVRRVSGGVPHLMKSPLGCFLQPATERPAAATVNIRMVGRWEARGFPKTQHQHRHLPPDPMPPPHTCRLSRAR